MVPRCEVRHVHPLGRLQSAGPGRMGDAAARTSGRDVRVARHHVQSGEVRGARVGVARKGGRSEVHHDHVAPPRRLLDVRDPRDAVQHRGLDAVQARPAEAAGGRVPATRPQAVLLLFTARLASSRLLAARPDGPAHRPPRSRRLGPLSRFHGQPAHGAAHGLRSHRRHLVRRHVGQARRGLASVTHLHADPSAAARGAHRAQPPHGTPPGRGRGPSSRIFRARTRPASTQRRSGRCR